jgi:glycosyltransferase involved in cell wall biosynthesis
MSSSKSEITVHDQFQVDVSVAICTYNRPQMVLGVFETLEQQECIEHITWEVLVIDNDPTLSARLICERRSEANGLVLRYIHEPRQGLSHARNRAVSEARGSIIAFLDDDVVVPSRWLIEILRSFERSGADCVGGRVLVLWDGHPDEALKACERELVAFDKGIEDGRLFRQNVPIGANLALRIDVLREQVPFSPNLGRQGASLMGCEEVELLLRLMRQGKKIWYSAGGAVMHRTGGERLTAAYYKRRAHWDGLSLAAVDKLQNSWAYCHFKAWARLAQVALILWPAWLWASWTRNRRTQLLNVCAQKKYIGYALGIVRLG